MHSPIKRYLHNETPCSYGQLPDCILCKIVVPISRSPQHSWWGLALAETRPAQWVTLYKTQTCLFLFRRCSLLHCSCKHFRNAKWEYFVTTWDCDFILILYSTVVWTHTWRPQNRSDLTNQRIQLAIRKVSAWKIMPYMEMIGILPRYNTMKCQLQSMSGTLLGTCCNVSYSPK